MPLYKHTISPVTTEPIGLEDMAEWLRIDQDQDRVMVEALIKSARARVENLANQDFTTRTHTIVLDSYCEEIVTNVWPINNVSVQYLVNGGAIIYTPSKIRIKGSRVYLTESISPDDVADAITLTITTLPIEDNLEIAKIAIKLLVNKWYDNRADQKYEVPSMVEAMLTGIRNITI